MDNKAHNVGFGRYTSLRPITTVTAEEEKDPDKIPKTRIIRISEPLYRRFVGHSRNSILMLRATKLYFQISLITIRNPIEILDGIIITIRVN